MTTATINYTPDDAQDRAAYHVRGMITNTGVARLANATQAGKPFSITMAKFGSGLINTESDDQLRSSTDVSGVVYQSGQESISVRLQAQDVVAYDIYLDAEVGNFSIGNFGLFDSEGNLIILVALNDLVKKTNPTSADGPNALSFVCLVQYSNISGAINVNILENGSATVPVVMNTGDLPDGTKSPYPLAIVQNDPTFGGVANLFWFSNNSWGSGTPASVGHYLYQNLQNAAVKYNAGVNDSVSATVLQGNRGSLSVTVQGSFPLPPYTQYTVSGNGVAPDTYASGASAATFRQQTLTLADPLGQDVAYQSAVTVQTSYVDTSSSVYPCYSQMTGNKIVLDGNYTFNDADTTYTVSGEYIPNGTIITQTDTQEHDTIVRNRVQVSPAALSDSPPQSPCVLTATAHYSAEVKSVGNSTNTLRLASPTTIPNVSSSTTIQGTFTRMAQPGQTPTVTVPIKAVEDNGDGTYTVSVDSVQNIQSGTFGAVQVTTVTQTTLRNGSTAGQNEVDIDGSFDTALVDYVVSGPMFQTNTRIIDSSPTLQNTTTITISNSIQAPSFVQNVTISAAKTVAEEYQTTASLPSSAGSNSISVNGNYSNPRYVKTGDKIYAIIQTVDTSNTGSRTVLNLTKPLLTDLTPGQQIVVTNPDSPVGDFYVLNRILSGFLSKEDSSDFVSKLQSLLQGTYDQAKAGLQQESQNLISSMGSSVNSSLSTVQTSVQTFQTALQEESDRAKAEENRLEQRKLNITGGSLEGALTALDSVSAIPSGAGNASLTASGDSGKVSLGPGQNQAGKYVATLTFTGADGKAATWGFNTDGTIDTSAGTIAITTATNSITQEFKVYQVKPGQFIKFPQAFVDDNVNLTYGASSTGYVNLISYSGLSRAGFEVNVLVFDQQGNLLPRNDSIIPELSIKATGKVS